MSSPEIHEENVLVLAGESITGGFSLSRGNQSGGGSRFRLRDVVGHDV
jgi:hypothetical protein